jgi:hypothetical protein
MRSPATRRGLAMAKWETHSQAFAFRAATLAAGHVGRRPGFIDEHEARRIEIDLVIEPSAPLPQDAGAFLLKRMACHFYA